MSYFCIDYCCPACGVTFESFEDRANPSPALPHCDTMAPRTLSSPMVLTQGVNVTRSSKSDDRPPGALDTRPLADGMSTQTWKAKRTAERKAIISKRVRNMVS